jgi:carbon-monoxide dehydrogenase large subunit
VPGFSRYVATGLYDIERVELDLTIVVTNRAPTGSYRGAGRPEAALAIERAVDAFARAAGLDPFEVRLRNYIPSDALPYRAVTGALYDSGDYSAALRRAMELLDLDALRSEQAERLRSGGPFLGVGVGSFIERAGGAVDSWEYGRVEIDPVRRKVVVRTGSTDTGQGHATVWRRLAAERFGIDDVEVHAKDTAEVADGIGSFASRSAQIGGSAVVRTADRVLDAARRRAADRLEAAVEDIEYEAGVFRVAGSPGSELTIWELAAESELADEEKFSPHAQTFPYGAHAAVVEVLPETGEVRVRKIVAVDDCGVVLDPMIVEGQLHGSLVQGLGQALYERIVYDDAGQPVTSSLMDYSMPAAGDIPPIVSDRLIHPAPSNPLGVKGAGEAGCIGLPPAILNATLDALAPLGVTHLDLPLRPVSVWQAIRDAEETRNG